MESLINLNFSPAKKRNIIFVILARCLIVGQAKLLLHYFWAIMKTDSICVWGNFRMNLKILWDDLDDFGMSLIKIG